MSPNLAIQWKQQLIRRAATEFCELEGVSVNHEDAEAWVESLLAEYDQLIRDIINND